jgi:hypothetical protein
MGRAPGGDAADRLFQTFEDRRRQPAGLKDEDERKFYG